MKKISKLILGLLALPMCLTHSKPAATIQKANAFDIVKNQKTEVIDLQEKVFERYYSDLKTEVREKVSLAQFKELYQKGDLTAPELVTKLNSLGALIFTALIAGAIGLAVWDYIDQARTIGTTCWKDVPDADYIISDNHNRTVASKQSGYTPKPSWYSNNDKNWATEQSSIRDFDFYDTTYDANNHINNHGPRKPVYYGNPNSFDPSENNFEYYYDYLQIGDLVWDPISGLTTEDCPNLQTVQTWDMVNAVTHMGMIVQTLKCGRVVNSNGNSEYFNFIETVEAVASGVRFGVLDDERILRFGTKVLRVIYASQSERINAVSFMVSQVGKPYTLKILDDYQGPVWGENNSTWYCTQLVFAAYYHAGVNICRRFNCYSSDYFAGDGVARGNVIGHMIANGDYVGDLQVQPNHYYAEYLTVEAGSKEGSYYNMEIHNNTNEDIIAAYYPQLCGFSAIASHFREVQFKHVKVPANSFVTVAVRQSHDEQNLEQLVRSWHVYHVKNNTAYCTIVNRVLGPNTWPDQYNYAVFLNRTHVMIAPNGNETYTIQLSRPAYWNVRAITNLVPESDLNRWNFRRATADYIATYSGEPMEVKFTNAAYYGSWFGVRSMGDSNGNFTIYKWHYDKDNNLLDINPTTVTNNARHIRFCLSSKQGNKWRLDIHNIEGVSKQIAFTNKMTTENNAKTWTGLNGICTTRYLSAYEGMFIDVQVNGNNPAVGISYKIDGKRYISWAKNLKDKQEGLNGGTLTWNTVTLDL